MQSAAVIEAQFRPVQDRPELAAAPSSSSIPAVLTITPRERSELNRHRPAQRTPAWLPLPGGVLDRPAQAGSHADTPAAGAVLDHVFSSYPRGGRLRSDLAVTSTTVAGGSRTPTPYVLTQSTDSTDARLAIMHHWSASAPVAPP